MSLSAISLSRLATCHPDLIKLVTEVSRRTGIMVLCGHRNEAEQNKAFADKKSRLKWPSSRHNSWPSEAVDITPAKLDWNDIASFKRLAKVVKDAALDLDILVEHGGDWAMRDFPHWELVAVIAKK